MSCLGCLVEASSIIYSVTVNFEPGEKCKYGVSYLVLLDRY